MKQKGKILPPKSGPVPFGERRDRGELELRAHACDADGQQDHGAELDERREVVARGEKEPHRENRSGETVAG